MLIKKIEILLFDTYFFVNKGWNKKKFSKLTNNNFKSFYDCDGFCGSHQGELYAISIAGNSQTLLHEFIHVTWAMARHLKLNFKKDEEIQAYLMSHFISEYDKKEGWQEIPTKKAFALKPKRVSK